MLGGQIHMSVPAANVVYFFAFHAHTALQLRHNGNEHSVYPLRIQCVHTYKPSQQHVAGKARMHTYCQYGAVIAGNLGIVMGVALMVNMVVLMIMVVLVLLVHILLTTLAAAQAAPYPLSIFIIPTPGAQLESMLARAALPCSAAP